MIFIQSGPGDDRKIAVAPQSQNRRSDRKTPPLNNIPKQPVLFFMKDPLLNSVYESIDTNQIKDPVEARTIITGFYFIF